MTELNNSIFIHNAAELLTLKKYQRIQFECRGCGRTVSRVYLKTRYDIISRFLCKECGFHFTNQKRYGVQNPMQNKSIVAKLRESNLEKYHTACTLQTPDSITKKKNTWQKKYGVSNPFQILQVKYNRSKYHYRGIGFDSSWELAFYLYHEAHGANIVREPCKWEYSFEGKTQTIAPDFSVNGVYYEIKGDHLLRGTHQKRTQRVLEVEREHNTIILFQKDIQFYLNWVKKNYSRQYLTSFLVKKEYKMQLKPIINSLLDQDAYKYSMGQAIFHQHNGKMATWAFKCRNKDVVFTVDEVNEIKAQIQHYCTLRYTNDELEALRQKCPWLRQDYIDFLRFWHPRYEDILVDDQSPCGLRVRFSGVALNVSPYETPVMAIITETHYKMSGQYADMLSKFKDNTDKEIEKLRTGEYNVGCFSEFGFRRRLSFEAQNYFIQKVLEAKVESFIGTSNVYFAVKYGVKAVGSVAHEFIMLCGQGYPERNPAYSNQYAMESWVKEYGILNGIALTDTIGTDVFLQDFRLTFSSLFSGVRHDSGDPYLWGEKMIKHYEKYGIDPKTKTLLFSDSLDLERATKLYEHFKDRVKVAFGIGTALVGPVHDALNIVIKPVQFDGQPVAKLSDAPGKGMCEDQAYVDYLRRAVDWRMCNVKA